jgi:hypothetical protein
MKIRGHGTWWQISTAAFCIIKHVSEISSHYRCFSHKIWRVFMFSTLDHRVRKKCAYHETTVSQDIGSSSTCHCVIHSLSEPSDVFLMLSIVSLLKGCGLVRAM